MIRTYKIPFNTKGFSETIKIPQYDKGYVVKFDMTDLPKGITTLNEYTAIVEGARADGLAYSFPCIISDTLVSFVVDTTCTGVEGKGEARIRFLLENEEIASHNFIVQIEKAPVPDGAVDANVKEARRAQQALDEMENRLDTFLSNYGAPVGSQKDPELTDLRVGADGVVYTSAGEAVRRQIIKGSRQYVSVANSASEMTDENRIYVYTGNESSFDHGHWYYFDTVNESWIDGGDYVGNLEEYIRDWMSAHPEATTSVQDGSITEEKLTDSLKVKVLKDYVTPQMYGAKGDGVKDDTYAIQSAFDSSKMVVFPNGTYNISAPLEIKHDIRVLCDVNVQLRPVATMDALLKVGVTIDGYVTPAFTNLVKVLWDGGTFWGAYSSYEVTDVIYTEKTYHSLFSNVTIVNVSTNGVHIAGDVGAYCCFDNCVVRGKYGNGQRGFFVERSDQAITNCSVIDCIRGFETTGNSILFDKCTAWMANDMNWKNTICFYLGGFYNKITNSIIDTMFYGIRFKSDFKYGSANNLQWINNYAVVADTTDMSLLSTDEPASGYLVNFPVEGLIIGTFNNTAYIKRDLASGYHTFVNNIVAKTPEQIADLFTASIYKENKTYTYGTGVNQIAKTNYGLKFIHDSELNSVPSGTVIDLATWRFPAISGALPVTCLNNNNGDRITSCALYCNSGVLQFVLRGSGSQNVKIHVDLDIPQYSI